MDSPAHWQPTSINSDVQIIPVNHQDEGGRESESLTASPAGIPPLNLPVLQVGKTLRTLGLLGRSSRNQTLDSCTALYVSP